MKANAAGSTAHLYANELLEHLGTDLVAPSFEAPHPDEDWRASGAMALTGETHGPALLIDAPAAACARGAWRALCRLAPTLATRECDGPALLGERAAVAGLQRRGRTSVGGQCDLMETRSGWLAVQHARPDDTDMFPAWLEEDRPDHCGEWEWLTETLRSRDTRPLVERARLMGLPIAQVGESPVCAESWCTRTGPRGSPRWRGPTAGPHTASTRLRVLDLSTLWAGPLAGRLLFEAGHDVVKVESAARPDGARRGPRAFFDLMNAGKSSVRLDPHHPPDHRRLRKLMAAADIVIESARPRGLVQLGIQPEAVLASHPGLTWVSITGYGRRPPNDNWVAFGDDAAAASGLVAWNTKRQPLFCGDAIADPLTGLHAAAAGLAGAALGGGLFDVSLAGVAAGVAGTKRREQPLPADGHAATDPAPPRHRAGSPHAPALGADTETVDHRWLGGTHRC